MYTILSTQKLALHKKQVKNLLLGTALLAGITIINAQNRTISVDYSKTAGPLNTTFNECIGAGRANEGLRADWQQQLAFVKQECGFRYIRMHGLLTDDMAVYKEDSKGNPMYNYMYIDALFDYLLSIDVKPFVELGFMPSQMASSSKTIFWWRGNVTPPKDYAKWEALIKNLIQHWTERYGAEEVKSWYFEVWNEPNLDGFWAGTQEEYFKLYKHAAKAIKEVNKAYKVGGPATAGAAWIPEMLEFCKKNNVPIDFASTHSYGVEQGFLDEFGNSGTVLSQKPMAVAEDVLKSRKEIQDSGLKNLELHYTEWSASYTPADPVHDSYHEAAYILEKLKQSGTAANSMSYWVFTDIFEEAGPRFEAFHGGFGLLTIQGINKPAFYSYSFLNKLGNTELSNADSRSWVTKDTKGGLQVLLWDFTNTHPGKEVNNQVYYIKDLPAKGKGKATVQVKGMAKGTYKVEAYKVGYKANDAHTAYVEMGRPAQLNKQQVEKLKAENNGKAYYTGTVTIKADGTFSFDADIRENDVIFLNVTKQ
ncbi:glycoside hydrolase [Flavobacterium akiainvivens]|uniref:Glycoside hydrolase n=1 Tax=Flavobacterium akiainvivens TaxID=1202724 RepID=A0A0M8MJ71_9FLAO|nr:glycoside hydrolase [Flavobacterium akiainvivens]KOS06668.1 glycoside hydrolase [Flavobacterium akiainvivens]SFQ70667.1 xylan 1,4-beta-xylosidase [Flavobacterium akiainvivens]